MGDHCNRCKRRIETDSWMSGYDTDFAETGICKMCVVAGAEVFVQEHGEHYRKLIESAWRWLEEQEPYWGLDKPIDRDAFIAGLVSRAH